jgi:hypothetical protein
MHEENMSAERTKIETAGSARRDLEGRRTKPAWRESSHTLPFGELTSDEFEVLCYLVRSKNSNLTQIRFQLGFIQAALSEKTVVADIQ